MKRSSSENLNRHNVQAQATASETQTHSEQTASEPLPAALCSGPNDQTGLNPTTNPVRKIFAYNILGSWLAYIPDGDWKSKNGIIKKLFWKIGIYDSIQRKCYNLSKQLAANSPKPSLRVRWIRQWEILRLMWDDLLGKTQSKQNFR